MGAILPKAIINLVVNPILFFATISSITAYTSKIQSNTIKYIINAFIIISAFIVAGLIVYYSRKIWSISWIRTILVLLLGSVLFLVSSFVAIKYITK
jgi:hypothetical protein